MTIETKKLKVGNVLKVDITFRHDDRRFAKGALLSVLEVHDDYINIDEPHEGSWNISDTSRNFECMSVTKHKIIPDVTKSHAMSGFIALNDRYESIQPMRTTKQEARDDIAEFMKESCRDPYIAEIKFIEQITPRIKITKIRK